MNNDLMTIEEKNYSGNIKEKVAVLIPASATVSGRDYFTVFTVSHPQPNKPLCARCQVAGNSTDYNH